MTRDRDRVLLLLPTSWDEVQLARAARVRERFEVVTAGPRDDDCRFDLDVERLLDALEREHRGRIAGVASTSDYPGAALAALLARRLALPGPNPAAVVRAGCKLTSRRLQAAALPRETPAFRPVDAPYPERGDAGAAGLRFPCFVKPVRGSFSRHARVVSGPEELRAHLESPAVVEHRGWYGRLHDALARIAGVEVAPGGSFIAEEVLAGAHVTVEGFLRAGEATVLAVVDGIRDAGTGSFMSFELPSRLPRASREAAESLAVSAARALGLDDTAFNVELFVPPEGPARVIEVNPRACGQFADLHEHVSGTNGLEVVLDVACGRAPSFRRGAGRFKAARSRPLRTFAPVTVLRAPSPDEAARAAEAEGAALCLVECRAGDALADFCLGEDGRSARYAVVNAAAEDETALAAKLARLERALDFRLAPRS